MAQLLIDILWVLITIACVVGIYYLVVWVLQYLGLPIPVMVLRIVFPIIALLILIWVISIFLGGSSPMGFLPPMRR